MPMLARLCLTLLMLAAIADAAAQTRVRTETIRPPQNGSSPPKSDSRLKAPATQVGVPEIISDPSRLPPDVARARERILTAARSGDLQALAKLIRADETLFSRSEDKDPAAYWKENYPDSDGLEALSILITVLESPFVHVDPRSSQELYLWPYFARIPLNTLTPAQRTELFRIITGGDYKDMLARGTYTFFQIGIAPDGKWQFFVSGP
jgi:hypothetical protein